MQMENASVQIQNHNQIHYDQRTFANTIKSTIDNFKMKKSPVSHCGFCWKVKGTRAPRVDSISFD